MDKRDHSKLPGQLETIFDPALKPKQMKIIIIGFRKYDRIFDEFPAPFFEGKLHKFLTKNNFFNEKNFKGKRSKGATHLTTTHTHRAFYSTNARITCIIRPVMHPSVNLHTIGRSFNKFIKDDRIMTVWLSQDDFDENIRSRTLLTLTLKAMNYECEGMWNRTRGLRLRNTVKDYDPIMTARERFGIPWSEEYFLLRPIRHSPSRQPFPTDSFLNRLEINHRNCQSCICNCTELAFSDDDETNEMKQ